MKIGTELDAINRAHKALDWLSPEGKGRALNWLASTFNLTVIRLAAERSELPVPVGAPIFEPLPEPTEGAAHG